MRGLLVGASVLALLGGAVPVTADHVPNPPKTAQELTLYHTWPQLTLELREMGAANPDLMSIESIGKSVLGLDLWGVHLYSEEGIPLENREKIYLDGGIHANEQLGMELALAFIHYLVDGYGTDDNATWILQNRDVFIVPMVNPDGNMRDTRINTRLVDLNRNFPYGWGGEGASDMIGTFTYRGPSPASEPEVQAVMALIRAFDPDYSQSYHTGTTMFLFPWGGNESKVEDYPVYQRICEEINATDPEDRFPCGPVYTTIYPATGGTVDFAYGDAGAISFTFEVDDEQFQYISLETIRDRLAVPFDSTLHAFLNVEKYGNHPAVELLSMGHDDDGHTLRLRVVNDGYGESASTTLRVLQGDATVSEVRLGRLARDAPVEIELAAGEGDEVVLEAEYEKTLFKPNVKVTRAVLQLEALDALIGDATEGPSIHPIGQQGLDVTIAEQSMETTAVGDGDAGIPAPPTAALILLAAVGAVLVRRRIGA